jgi:hypothetical protein
MFTRKVFLFLVGIIILLIAACQTAPKEVKETSHNIPSYYPQGLMDFEKAHINDLVGIGRSLNQFQRKNYALDEIARQINTNTYATWVNFYSNNVNQSYIFSIDIRGFLSSSTLSSWFKENDISPKDEYSEGDWYAVAYDIPERKMRGYPYPIMPVTTLFTIEEAVQYAAWDVSGRLPGGSKIAIINISAQDPNDAEFVVEELSTELVKIARENNKGYTIVDRNSLDEIRKEQKFQLSGDVSDDTIVSIGKFLGADVVITGSITGVNEFRRLRVKALDVLTARLLIQTNLKY